MLPEIHFITDEHALRGWRQWRLNGIAVEACPPAHTDVVSAASRLTIRILDTAHTLHGSTGTQVGQRLRSLPHQRGRNRFVKVGDKPNGQIGLERMPIAALDAAVAVVNVREPIILINPKVIEQWDEIDYYEGCLSFPEKGVHTKRYRNIIVQTEQEESGWYFSGVETSSEGKGTWETEGRKHEDEQRLLEVVCVQHEIDHLNGVLFIDYLSKLRRDRVIKKFAKAKKATTI